MTPESPSSKYWYIKSNQIFDQLNDDEYKEIEWITGFKACKKNEFLYMPEEQHRKVYFLKKGMVKIGMYNEEGDEIVLDILKQGDWFGEVTFGDSKGRSEFAMAMSNDTLLYNFNASNLEDLLRRKPEIAIRYTKKIGSQQISLSRRFSSIIFKDARQRLLDFFKQQAMETKPGEITNIKYPNYLTHQDIASLNGLARQTVTTMIGQFKEEGILDFDRKSVFIPDLKKLR
jgi:CRP/FNR family transcriptional regulator